MRTQVIKIKMLPFFDTGYIRGVIKKFSARYTSVRFVELKSLAAGHLILWKDIRSVKGMWSCLVAYVKNFKRAVCDTFANGETLNQSDYQVLL